MPQTDHAFIILAGGAGTRLWPLSTMEEPKQFLALFGGASLIQKTFRRLALLTEAGRIFVSTHERYVDKVREQLPDLPPENILLEPSSRNTAPAIASCCAVIRARLGEVVVGVFPSDHAIADLEGFCDVANAAAGFAGRTEYLVTIGIQPDEPNTGFGYLELDEEIEPGMYRLRRFVEKPDLERAQQFLAAGNFLWNGGMFVWRTDVFFAALADAAPEIAAGSTAFAQAKSAQERETVYGSMPSISIDYALMERAPRVATVPGRFDWSDVGSWAAVAKIAGSGDGTNVHLEQSPGVYVKTDGSRPVVVVGAENLAVIDSPNGLLVIDLAKSELLSPLVKRLTR